MGLLKQAAYGVLLWGAATACNGSHPEPAAPPSTRAEDAPLPADAPRGSGQPTAAAAQQPTLTASALGPFRVGAAMPTGSLSDEALSAGYRATFYADAQPLEGFELTDPPALVVVADGAFAAWGYDHPGEAAPDAIKAQTIASAKAGEATVSMLVVTAPSVQTPGGVHAGMTYAEFHARQPSASAEQVPPLWEEPSCVARSEGLWVFFDRCPANGQPPDDARVLRIVARGDGH